VERFERYASIACESVELVYDDRIERSCIGVDKHLSKFGTFGDIVSACRATFVSIDPVYPPPMTPTVLPTGVLLGIK
jgi:hypothetical protein